MLLGDVLYQMNLLKVVSGENGQGASLYKKNPLGARLSVQRCAVFALLEQVSLGHFIFAAPNKHKIQSEVC